MISNDIFCKEPYKDEAFLVGLFYNDPQLYGQYTNDKLNTKHFGNNNWAFWFKVGRYLYERGADIYDDTTIIHAVQELQYEKYYDLFGKYETIKEIIEEVKNKYENIDMYYSTVKKYSLLRNLRNLLGDQIIKDKDNEKYNYKEMTGQQLQNYWNDKLNQLFINEDSPIEQYNLLENLGDFIEQIDEEPLIGIDYFNCKKLTELTNGIMRGTLTIFSGFSGTGKSSFFVHSVLLSFIKNYKESKEKILVIANEMSIEMYKKLLLVSVIPYIKEKGEKGFDRKNINRGNFTDHEKDLFKRAIGWIEECTEGDNSIIKFVPMENYTIENVEKVIRYFAVRNYNYVTIDTTKVSVGGSGEQRWARFLEDFEKLYQIIRADGGGLNLGMFCTVQAADSYLHRRYIDENSLGESKKIRNVADIVLHTRKIWDSELQGGKHELTCYKYVKNDFGDGYRTEEFLLEPGKNYIAIFCSKNRYGMSNQTGAPVIIFSVDYNSNRFYEIGFAKVPMDIF